MRSKMTNINGEDSEITANIFAGFLLITLVDFHPKIFADVAELLCQLINTNINQRRTQ